MASRPEDRVDFVRSMGRRPVLEQSTPGVSEDAMWVSAARDGDRTAFGRLYRRYARMVHGVLLAKVPMREVDDLAEDVFIMALRRLSTLRETESFGPWLAAIARNLASDYHRRSVPEDQLTDDTTGTYIASGRSDGDHEGLATEILEVVRSLPDAYRETLNLRLVEGMTRPEIAARTRLTHGPGRDNLHRAIE